MKKKTIMAIILILLGTILVLWITGIIPLQIARIASTNYVNKKYPEMELEFVAAEWASSFGGYSVTFKERDGKMVGFIMNNKYFPTEAGQGDFALMDTYRIEYKTGISDINDFYNHRITSNYKPIRSISNILSFTNDYTIEEALRDNCFVSGKSSNDLYTEFMDKYNKKENAFIRIAKSTIEGDTIIVDVLYEALTDKFHLVADYTRDKESSIRRIDYKTYEKTIVLDNRWYVYNGELPEIIGKNNDNIYSIAIVN